MTDIRKVENSFGMLSPPSTLSGEAGKIARRRATCMGMFIKNLHLRCPGGRGGSAGRRGAVPCEAGRRGACRGMASVVSGCCG